MEAFILNFLSFLEKLDFAMLGKYLVYVFIAFWFFVSVWAWFDASERYKSRIWVALWFLIVLVFNIFGLLIYIILRPKSTKDENNWLDLERRYLSFESAGLSDCPRCGQEVYPNFIYCPKCGKDLRYKCKKCEVYLEPEWNTCPFCGTPQRKVNLQELLDPKLIKKRIREQKKKEGVDKSIFVIVGERVSSLFASRKPKSRANVINVDASKSYQSSYKSLSSKAQEEALVVNGKADLSSIAKVEKPTIKPGVSAQSAHVQSSATQQSSKNVEVPNMSSVASNLNVNNNVHHPGTGSSPSTSVEKPSSQAQKLQNQSQSNVNVHNTHGSHDQHSNIPADVSSSHGKSTDVSDKSSDKSDKSSISTETKSKESVQKDTSSVDEVEKQEQVTEKKGGFLVSFSDFVKFVGTVPLNLVKQLSGRGRKEESVSEEDTDNFEADKKPKNLGSKSEENEKNEENGKNKPSPKNNDSSSSEKTEKSNDKKPEISNSSHHENSKGSDSNNEKNNSNATNKTDTNSTGDIGKNNNNHK
ncbi:zinc ribbon domain-containing protein [Candidatus Dojkabacteria bacterium]|nr:zinc ribbon domain-containing protein [Candidatus Dojkabacteria bacterium]